MENEMEKGRELSDKSVLSLVLSIANMCLEIIDSDYEKETPEQALKVYRHALEKIAICEKLKPKLPNPQENSI